MTLSLKAEYITLTKESRLYNIDIPIIAVTGGIATGKSTMTRILEKQGMQIICADSLVKMIYKDERVINYLKEKCPTAISNGVPDFPALRKIFFNAKKIKEESESIIFSYYPILFKEKVKSIKNQDFILYDIPLLFEKNLEHFVDQTICIYAKREIQISRILKRDHCTKDMANKILNNQLDIEEKKLSADFTLFNDKDKVVLQKETEKIFQKMFKLQH